MLDSVLKSISAVPEFILSISTLISLFWGTIKQKKIDRNMAATAIVSLILLCILLFLSGKSEQFFWNSLFIYTSFSVHSKIILYCYSAVALFFLFSFLAEYKIKQFEWIFIAIFVVIGGSVALSSNHFLTLFIGLEMSHLSQYILVNADRDASNTNEATIKFFTINLISTGLMLFGVSLIYGFTGTGFFNTVYYFFESYSSNFEYAGAIVGMMFVLMGICFKLPIFPFHAWIQDLYQVSALPIILFIASISKIITVFSLLHLLTYPFHGAFICWRYLLIGLAIFSMIWGSLMALRQQNLRRMFACSTVSDMGFLLIGPSMGGDFGLSSAITYIIFYTLNILGVFSLLIVFEKNCHRLNDIRDLSGIIKEMPLLSGIFCFLILSFAGIPPFPGFFAKIYILESTINRSAYFIAILSVLITVINAGYYLNVLKFFVLKSSALKINKFTLSEKYFVKVMIVLIIIALCGMVIFPLKLLEIVHSIAVSILF